MGDLLLAGPALMAVRERYPGARLVGLGHPERWGLLSTTLSLAAGVGQRRVALDPAV